VPRRWRVYLCVTPPPHDLPWADLARWFAGELSSEEAARLEAWVGAEPERAALVAALRKAWSVAGAPAEGWDPARALSRIREAAAEEARVIGRLGSAKVEPPNAVRRWAALALAAAAGVGVVLGVTTIAPLLRAPATLTEYRAARGQRLTLRLGDGTQVTLAPGTVLRRPSDYGRRERRLELEGEAYFIVTHDSTRPFTVATARLIARDVGTRFNVRAYADDSATAVVVAEGQVAVRLSQTSADASNLVLGAGDVGDVRNGTLARTRGVSVDQVLAWTEGRLVFRDTPLAEVVTRLARWYDVDVRLGGRGLAGLRVTGSFRDEPVGVVLDAVARSLDLRLDARQGGYELSR
jgi:transmembrane sensor